MSKNLFIDFFEILLNNNDDRSCPKLPKEVFVTGPQSYRRISQTKSDTEKFPEKGYECSYGRCIQDSENQPNGNKLCMMNFQSIEIALENCEIHKCDKIAKYNYNGTGIFKYNNI